jgi:hypothetical protein
MSITDIQYISDTQGNIQSVIVHIDVWKEIEAEMETAHLLSSEPMKQRLLESINRDDGIPMDEVHERLGI